MATLQLAAVYPQAESNHWKKERTISNIGSQTGSEILPGTENLHTSRRPQQLWGSMDSLTSSESSATDLERMPMSAMCRTFFAKEAEYKSIGIDTIATHLQATALM
jgi:hypothetical protein